MTQQITNNKIVLQDNADQAEYDVAYVFTDQCSKDQMLLAIAVFKSS